MSPSHLDTIRRHCPPLEPLPTRTEPVLGSLRGIRAVLFDVYGTLFISASGDVGTGAVERRGEAFGDALRAIGIPWPPREDVAESALQRLGIEHLMDSIGDAHRQAVQRGIEYPEVDILAIWDDTIGRLRHADLLPVDPSQLNLARLAVEYEVRVNPTWPMPGVVDCLHCLRARGQRLGLISNAQFFTPKLFPALLNQTAEAFGLEPELQFYSYQWGQAKPGRFLYERAAEALSRAEVPPHNVLYIGNDMLNDVATAHQVGFRTALFAGDARSLRLRSGDARVGEIAPELIVTHLSQLVDCIK